MWSELGYWDDRADVTNFMFLTLNIGVCGLLTQIVREYWQ